MSTKKFFKITERDRSVLLFLWYWKVFTTTGLAAKFFSGSAIVAYNRMLLLRDAGLVQCVGCDIGNKNFVWTLNKSGFQYVRTFLPELKEEGYASEAPLHDLIAASVHLGEWLLKIPVGVNICTEQELRRLDSEMYPNWVSDLTGRRPDGLWQIPFGDAHKIFALEVELTRKNPKEYGPIAHFYEDQTKIARVFWLTGSFSQARRLHLAFQQETPNRFMKHNFLTFDDFRLHGWNAPIIFGFETGRPFKYALTAGQALENEVAKNLQGAFNAASLLDARKCPFSSTSSNPESRAEFLDSMALRPYPNPFPVLNLENISH